ncbi:MAG: hypothetical protein JW850_07830 [Thermoflexales bacterium]|nr:hypothetical protein [Thermoflexales bacterium]
MTEITITQILDDLRAADETTRRYERRYWLSSADFYELYSQGRLDDGEHTEDFAIWAGFYEVKRDRETSLRELSRQRVQQLLAGLTDSLVSIVPPEPALRITEA